MPKKRSKKDSKAATGTMRVTSPGGRVSHHPDDGREYPDGTMLMWDITLPDGRKEMRWTVTGGGWPFDD